MKILSVELTNYEALSVVSQFIEQIDTLAICAGDKLERGTEIEVETEHIDFIANVCMYSEYNDFDLHFASGYNNYETPEPPTLISQSLSCKIKAYSKDGYPVQFQVEPKIDIQQEIEKYYKV